MRRLNFLTLSISVLALQLLLLSGCQQDPMQGYSDNVQKPILPQNKFVIPKKPTDPNFMILDADEHMNFKEGAEGKFRISGRMFVPGITYSIEVDGKLPPGATFTQDPNAPDQYIFVWSPPAGFTLGDIYRSFTLSFAMISNTEPIMKISKEVQIYVNKNFRTPTIVGVKPGEDQADLGVPLQEGQARTLIVEVEDQDADVSFPPELAMLNQQKSVAPFTTIKFMKVPAPGRFLFEIKMDTQDRELTTSSDSYWLNLRATSRFGITSGTSRNEVKILSKVQPPLVSLKPEIDMKIGRDNKVDFVVEAPNGEGRPEIEFDGACGDGISAPSCSCENGPNSAIQICHIEWKIPPRIQVGTQSLNLKVTNRGYEFSADFPNSQELNFGLQINIIR